MEQQPYLNNYEKPAKFQAVLVGATVIALLSGLPGVSIINCCCCAGIMLGGVSAVLFYKKKLDEHSILFFQSSDALILGILSGILGAVVTTILSTLIMLLIGPIESELFYEFFKRAIEQLEASGSVPEGAFDETIRQLEEALSQGVTFGSVLRELALSLIIYPIFSMIGSLITYGITSRRHTPQQ